MATSERRDFEGVDFFRDEAVVADPYPYFDFLREQGPVVREPQHGVFMVTGYEEAWAIYADNAAFSSCNSVTGPFPGFPVPLAGDDVSAMIEEHRNELPFSDQLTTMDPPAQRRRLTVVPERLPQATELADPPVLTEAEMLRARALRLLAIGVGDHTPAEVREQVAAIARRLAELEPGAPVDEWH